MDKCSNCGQLVRGWIPVGKRLPPPLREWYEVTIPEPAFASQPIRRVRIFEWDGQSWLHTGREVIAWRERDTAYTPEPRAETPFLVNAKECFTDEAFITGIDIHTAIGMDLKLPPVVDCFMSVNGAMRDMDEPIKVFRDMRLCIDDTPF